MQVVMFLAGSEKYKWVTMKLIQREVKTCHWKQSQIKSELDGSLLFNDFNFPPCMPMNFQEAEIMECTYSLAVQLKYDCEACRSDPLP